MITDKEFLSWKEQFDTFTNVEDISEIIILGVNGSVRRIILEGEKQDDNNL